MFIIKKILIKDNKFILTYLLNTVVLIFTFNLLLDEQYILYPFFLSMLFLVIYLLILYGKYAQITKSLQNLKIRDYLVGYSTDFKDELYLGLIKDLHLEYNNKLSKFYEKYKRNDLMFSQFIHNMKTSVSVIELASSSENENSLEDIVSENRKLKELLEQSLNVLRMEQFSQDYVPEKHDILEIVKTLINNNKTNFIYNGVFPKIVGPSAYVYTDKKWCIYLLNQVLSNSIKYSNENSTVYFNIINKGDSVTLQIVDEGIGIPNKDLNRVFELFYTGNNGRKTNHSTGIGLAMVKNVAKFLSHEINLTSEVNKGTTFEITFLTKM